MPEGTHAVLDQGIKPPPPEVKKVEMPMNKPFTCEPGQRPDGTSVLRGTNSVIHYTCNAPDDERLGELGIMSVGGSFGIAPREVVIIPSKLFDDAGIPKEERNTITAEQLLRSLTPKKPVA